MIQLNSEIPVVFNTFRPCSMFLSIKGYKDQSGGVQDVSLGFHRSYETACHRAAQIVRVVKPANEAQAQAQIELLESLAESLSGKGNSRATSAHVYVPVLGADGEPVKGAKYHPEKGRLYLWGFVEHRRVIVPAVHKPRKWGEVAWEKHLLRSMTQLGKFRQYILAPGNFDSLACEGMVFTDDAAPEAGIDPEATREG